MISDDYPTECCSFQNPCKEDQGACAEDEECRGDLVPNRLVSWSIVDCSIWDILLIGFCSNSLKFLSVLLRFLSSISSEGIGAIVDLRTVSNVVFTPLLPRIIFRTQFLHFGLRIHYFSQCMHFWRLLNSEIFVPYLLRGFWCNQGSENTIREILYSFITA